MRFDKKFNQILELHAPNARHDHEARSVGINFGHPRFFNTPNLSYAGVFFFFCFIPTCKMRLAAVAGSRTGVLELKSATF